jgi:hypothetical protein
MHKSLIHKQDTQSLKGRHIMQTSTRWIGLYTATLLMIATAVAGAAPGNQGQKSNQAGHSSIYHLDVLYNGKAVGQAVVDTANPQLPSYVLIAHGLTPNTKYTFGYTASGEVTTIGSTTTPKAGAFVLNGTFPLDDVGDMQSAKFWVMETPPSASYTEISGFTLFNLGGFVAQLACYYSTDGGVTWTESTHTGDITLNRGTLVNLNDYGIAAGALVKIHAIVVWGKDRTGSDVFQTIYYPGGAHYVHTYADYTIRGTTLNPSLEYDGLEYVCW